MNSYNPRPINWTRDAGSRRLLFLQPSLQQARSCDPLLFALIPYISSIQCHLSTVTLGGVCEKMSVEDRRPGGMGRDHPMPDATRGSFIKTRAQKEGPLREATFIGYR